MRTLTSCGRHHAAAVGRGCSVTQIEAVVSKEALERSGSESYGGLIGPRQQQSHYQYALRLCLLASVVLSRAVRCPGGVHYQLDVSIVTYVTRVLPQQGELINVFVTFLMFTHVLSGGVMFPMSPQSKCPQAKGISVDERKTQADLLLLEIVSTCTFQLLFQVPSRGPRPLWHRSRHVQPPVLFPVYSLTKRSRVAVVMITIYPARLELRL